MVWQIKKLSEICEIARGGSPRPITAYITDSEDGINWVKISDATSSEKYIFATKEKIKKEGLHKTRMVYPGDFILTNSMSFGRPYIMKTEGAIHDGWLLLRPDKSVLNEEYLYHFLSSDEVYKQFKRLASGAVVQNLNSELVRGVDIILPSLEIQKEIVEKLDEKFAKLREAKRLREEALVDTEKILSQTLREIFEEGKKKSWEEQTIGDMCIKITDGSHNPPTKEDVGEYIMLSSRNIYDGYITFDHPRYLTKDGFESENKRTDINIGDVLLTIVGTIGRCSVVNFENPKFTVQRSVAVLKPNNKLNSFYLSYWLRSPFIQEFLSVNARGAAQKGFYLKDIKALKILVPSISEQQKIVTRLDKLSEKIRTLRELQTSQLADLKRLEKSYLREAFNGELL